MVGVCVFLLFRDLPVSLRKLTHVLWGKASLGGVVGDGLQLVGGVGVLEEFLGEFGGWVFHWVI